MCPVSYDDNDDITIKGGTDSTTIGNVADRLKVDTAIGTPVPTTNVIYKHAMLLNGSSFNMNANGSVTPVNFDFTPATGETWFLERIVCTLGDPGTPDFNEFASLGAALTNGCDLLIRSNGVEYTIDNFKQNMGVHTAFAEHNYYPTNLGWLNEVDMFSGVMAFDKPIALTNATSDYVRLKVRDNLTNILFFTMSVKVWRTI